MCSAKVCANGKTDKQPSHTHPNLKHSWSQASQMRDRLSLHPSYDQCFSRYGETGRLLQENKDLLIAALFRPAQAGHHPSVSQQ